MWVLLLVMALSACSALSWIQGDLFAPSSRAVSPLTKNVVQQPAMSLPYSALDEALALHKPAMRSPFMADLAQHNNAPRYEVDLVLDAASHLISGTQTVRYTNQTQQPLTDLVLRLYPNTRYMGGQMALGDVRVNALQTAWSWVLPDQSAAQLTLLKSVAPGEAITLSLSFTLSVPSNSRGAGYLTFGEFDGLWALPNAYVMLAPRINNQWQVDPAPNYGDIVFAEMALYRVSLRAPSNFVVVATGACQTNGEMTSCTTGPVRDFALHLSATYDGATTMVSSIAGEPIQLSSYFLPQHRAAGERALEIAANALNSYEKRFGTYPYTELKIFATTTSAGGIEYPNLAGVLHNIYAANDDYFEWLVAHEVAHQWWYNLVGSNPITEPWLDESLTQYSTLLYFEDRYGAEVAQTYRSSYFMDRFVQERFRRGNRPVGQATLAFPRASYFPIVYGKGPLFFDEVRKRAGDDRFTAWLRTYHERHRYGTTQASNLLQAGDAVEIGEIVRAAYGQWILK
jgi:hypothetical protein